MLCRPNLSLSGHFLNSTVTGVCTLLGAKHNEAHGLACGRQLRWQLGPCVYALEMFCILSYSKLSSLHTCSR